MNTKWYAYLGIDDSGKIMPYIKQGEINVIGPRFEKSSTFPSSVYVVFNEGQPTPEQLITCLEDLQQWLDRSPNYNKKKK